MSNCIDSWKIYITKQADLNQANKNGATPAFVAAQRGYAEALRVLVEYKADLNQENKNGFTPELIAEELGHKKARQVILESMIHLINP